MPIKSTIDFIAPLSMTFETYADILGQMPMTTADLIQEVNGFTPTVTMRKNYNQGAHSQNYTADYQLSSRQTYLVKLLISNLIHNQRAQQEITTLIDNNADDKLLLILAIEMAKDKDAIAMIPKFFSPMVSRIIKMDLDYQSCIFQGNVETAYNTVMKRDQKIYSAAYNDKHLNHGEFGLARLIDSINQKATLHAYKYEPDAYVVAHALYTDLISSFKDYLSSDNKESALNQFKTEAKAHIANASPVLETHRGWKNVLANVLMHLALLVTTAGIGNVAALSFSYAQGNKSLLFPLVNTDSAQKINALEAHIDNNANYQLLP